jgi:transposase
MFPRGDPADSTVRVGAGGRGREGVPNDAVDEVVLDQSVEYAQRVAGIDIAKASAVVCVRLPHAANPGRRVQRVGTVPARPQAVLDLAARLVADRVELVVMESTGVYWKLWFFLLEDAGLRVQLVNPRDVRNVPSRPKTDRLDAIWLAKLAERGMLRPSFVPPKPVRRLRDLTRMRKRLVEDRSDYRRRVADVLEDAFIKVADKDDGLTDLFGVSGRAMLDALIAGERDPKTLANLARGKLRPKIPKLEQALAGRFEAHHAWQVQTLLDLHDGLDVAIAELEGRVETAIAEIDPTPPPDADHPDRRPLMDRLDEIPGVGRDTAAVIIAEVGLDPTVFPTGEHLASWAKLTPHTKQSGAKNTSGPTGKGNRWLKGALTQAAMTTGRTKTFLGARYRRLIKRVPKKKAQVAVARNILIIAWVLICDPDARYTDLGADWHTRRHDRARTTREHVRALERLGHTVTLTDAA